MGKKVDYEKKLKKHLRQTDVRTIIEETFTENGISLKLTIEVGGTIIADRICLIDENNDIKRLYKILYQIVINNSLHHKIQ